MAKPKSYLIRLEESDLGQVIDGIEARATTWRETAEFLKTGVPPRGEFSSEECSDGLEAENLADCYDDILDKIREQQSTQRSHFPEPNPQPLLNQPGAAFAIYINTHCDGPVPLERNEAGLPFVYNSAADAERVIAESMIERLNEYLAGERDFADATTVEEYVVPVQLHPDGSITDERKPLSKPQLVNTAEKINPPQTLKQRPQNQKTGYSPKALRTGEPAEAQRGPAPNA